MSNCLSVQSPERAGGCLASHSRLANSAGSFICLLAFHTFSTSFRTLVRNDLLIADLGSLNPVGLNTFFSPPFLKTTFTKDRILG